MPSVRVLQMEAPLSGMFFPVAAAKGRECFFLQLPVTEIPLPGIVDRAVLLIDPGFEAGIRDQVFRRSRQ
ncbi:hypothetical protein SDC9_181526 [bioreactor metagenome]|uniref:Uncharacterized protein n=1 Tax=bioreactor metagenome TaxID=1076179 RepID=A0A645HD59_9ZZZZ